MFILKAYGAVIGICGLMYSISRFFDFLDARARIKGGVLPRFAMLAGSRWKRERSQRLTIL
jgi:hypothetical protein